MDKPKIYPIRFGLILFFLICSIIFGLQQYILLARSENQWQELDFSQLLSSIFLLFVFGYSLYLLKKKLDGAGFYWDDEGVVIDLQGNKIYWKEISQIKKQSFLFNSTQVFVWSHSQDQVGKRIKKRGGRMPSYYIIHWVMVKEANEFHQAILAQWENRTN